MKMTNTKSAKADRLGEEYEANKERMSAIAQKQDSLKSIIKQFAEKCGQGKGKRIVVTGDSYEVGFITPEPTQDIDYNKLFELVPGLKAKITRPMVDEKFLSREIVKGKVSRKVLAKCLLPPSKEPEKRIYVAKLKGKKNETEKE
jgi:hypothetical protein